jgi:hypothetical protein
MKKLMKSSKVTRHHPPFLYLYPKIRKPGSGGYFQNLLLQAEPNTQAIVIRRKNHATFQDYWWGGIRL